MFSTRFHIEYRLKATRLGMRMLIVCFLLGCVRIYIEGCPSGGGYSKALSATNFQLTVDSMPPKACVSLER